MFNDDSVDLDVLRKRAYNLRWATVPEGVIPLTAADPDFPGAPQIAEAITRFVSPRYLCYGPPEGLPQFKESMSRFFNEKRAINYPPSLIFPVDSAAFGIYVTCKALLKPGDEAIIFDPVDFLFRYSIETLGATAVPFAIPAETHLVDFEKLESLVNKKTKMICLCNPLNPTGKVFTRQELQQLGELAVKHKLIVLSDEIWSDIVFEPYAYTSMAALGGDIAQHTITVTGFSKSYGLAGLRIGAVAAPNESYYQKLMEASLHQSTIHGANVIGQLAAATAMDTCGGWLSEFVAHLQQMRDLCVGELNSMKGITCLAPQGCYVAFADIRATGRSSSEIHALLLEQGKVAVVPGLARWFGQGAEGYIRLSFATSRGILSEAMQRIKTTLKDL